MKGRVRIVLTAAMASLLAASAFAQVAPPKVAVEEMDRITITATVPVPDVGKGAPYLASRDLKTIAGKMNQEIAQAQSDQAVCSDRRGQNAQARKASGLAATLLNEKIEAARRVTGLANTASSATDAAEAARRLAAAGTANMKDVETRELMRQSAVDQLTKARELLMEADAALADFKTMRVAGQVPQRIDLEQRAAKRQREGWGVGVAKPAVVDGLSLGDVRVNRYNDPTIGDFLRITGRVSSSSDKPILIPLVTAAFFDSRGWLLDQRYGRADSHGKVTERQPGKIAIGYILPAGQNQLLFFDVKDAPEHTDRVSFFFGSPNEPPRVGTMTMACRLTQADLVSRLPGATETGE